MKKVQFHNSKNEKITLNERALTPNDIPKAILLQDSIMSRINPAVFQPSFDWEILDSVENDYCCGLFDGDELVAFCVTVFNRQTNRNYCYLTEEPENYYKYFSFDSIQVKSEYRGFGIQRYFLNETQRIAKEQGAGAILATVAPDNTYSLNTFEKSGYKIYKNKEIAAYNSIRYLMIKEI